MREKAMGTFIRQRRGVIRTAGAMVALLLIFFGVRFARPALATSGGSPYAVPVVTDTNPDSDIVETTITAEPAATNIGNGAIASVLTFNGSIPGPEFRLKVGDTVIVNFVNNLGHPSGIHWHGIELENASDGTPLTQNMVPSGGSFLYKFKVHRPGIYMYHPHHHSTTNQMFKGLYGSIIVTDPNEAALEAAGVIPPPNQTKTLVLTDTTVCKAVGSNDVATYDPSLPHVSGGPLPAQSGPTPKTLCETSPIDEDGNPRAAFAEGDVPNIQKMAPDFSPVNEGQTVLTNGRNVGGRTGTPSVPGALAPGAQALDVHAGQGLRLQIVNAATTRFFRLILTDNAGTQIPLVRIGGQGGLLDYARVEGGVIGGFDFKYTPGELVSDPGDRVDVVAAIPASATGVLTLWTQDFRRTGEGFANLPTVPVAHFSVNGTVSPAYAITAGTPLRASIPGQAVEALGPATASLLDPSLFAPPKLGMASQDIKLTAVPGAALGIDGHQGTHDFPGDYTATPHELSARYAAALGDTLELTVTNTTFAHHPFHLHGFSLQPIDLTKPAAPSYTFPYKEFRDNIDVPSRYTLRFRVRLDDRPLMDGVTPGGGLGRWVFHCHILFHAVFGMISEFDVIGAGGNERPYINANGTSLSGHNGDALTMHGTYHDPDGDPVTLSASVGTIIDNGGGQWTWTGTATASGLVYVTATDSHGLKDQVAFALDIIICPTIVLSPAKLPGGAQGVAYSQPVTQSGSLLAVTFAVTGGTLPAGVTLSTVGVLSGTPTQVDTSSFTVTATDANGCTGGAAYTVTIVCPTTACFTDEPLAAGLAPIKTVHITELRARINFDRHAYGFPALTWTDPIIVPGATALQAQHLLELRAGVDGLYQIAAMPRPTYTDPTIQPAQTVIRAVHIEELRAALVALEHAQGIIPTAATSPPQ